MRYLIFAVGAALVLLQFISPPTHMVAINAISVPYNGSAQVEYTLAHTQDASLENSYYHYIESISVPAGRAISLTWSSDEPFYGFILTQAQYEYWRSHTSTTDYVSHSYSAQGAISCYVATDELMVALIHNQQGHAVGYSEFLVTQSVFEGVPPEPAFRTVTDLYYLYAAMAVTIIGNIVLTIPLLRGFSARASRPGGGGVMGAIKDSVTGGDAADELVDSLGSYGIKARVIATESLEAATHDLSMGGKFETLPLKTIKLEGRNVDRMELHRSGTKHGFYYYQKYIVGADVRHLGKDLTAWLKPEYEGTLSKKVVGYRWVDKRAGSTLGWTLNVPMFTFGLFFMCFPLFALFMMLSDLQRVVWSNIGIGLAIILLLTAVGFMMSIGQWIIIKRRRVESTTTLGRALNADTELTRMLTHAFKEAYIGVTPDAGSGHVDIIGGEVRRRVSSSFSVGGIGVLNPDAFNLGRRDFPSRDAFEVYDRIAGHIRRLAPEPPLAEGMADGDAALQGEYASQSAPSAQSRLPMQRPLGSASLLRRVGGSLVLIGFALTWLAVAYYLSGSNWGVLQVPLLIVGIFVAIGIISLVYGYRQWARLRGQRQPGPLSS